MYTKYRIIAAGELGRWPPLIIGVGVDSIEIARVADSIQRSPRLRQRLFTGRELAQLPPGAKGPSRLAALFAAKEAVFKALGTGLAGHSWLQVEIIHNQHGAPEIYLKDKAAETAACLGISKVHISLSHDQERAVAFCIAEGENRCNG
jgi:holo-[acyl-carrier protein] synthase